MGNLKRYMLPFLAIMLLVSLVESFRSFFLTYIIGPIALLTWAVVRILNSVNQNVYWIILIAVCVVLVIRLVPIERENIPRSTYNYRYRTPSRVEYWKGLIANAKLGDRDTEPLRESLKKLLASSLSEKEEWDSNDFEELVISERVRLSPRAKDFLFPSEVSGGELSSGGWFKVFFLIPEWLHKRAGKLVRGDTTSIDEILEYMETEMEIRHDQ